MTTHRFTSSADAFASFEAQGSLAPGSEGFWKVWGAQVRHILPGDLVLTLLDDEVKADLVADLFEAKAHPVRQGFISAEGDRFTLGALLPVIVLRWDTHNILA